MKTLKGKAKALRCTAALGFIGIVAITWASLVSSAENVPTFDNQGNKIYEALEKTPGTNLAADSWGRNLVDFYIPAHRHVFLTRLILLSVVKRRIVCRAMNREATVRNMASSLR